MADPQPLKVFLCHASEDKPLVRELYERLRADGFDPWLDSEVLLPGQDWDLEIQKAMRASDAVIVCFSSVSVSKEGEETLRFYRPEAAPLDYAMTQGNLGILHMKFRQLPGEDPRRRFAEAIQCTWRAYSLFKQIGHAPYEEQAKGLLAWLRGQDGELFGALWKELNPGPLPF